MKRLSRTVRRAILAVAMVAALASTADAGLLAVFSDINSMNANNAPRNQLLSNLLGSGTNVLLSKQNASPYDNSSMQAYFSSLGGVTSTSTGAELNSGLLAGVDLLMLNVGCCGGSTPQPYSGAEAAVVAAFLDLGGTVGIIAEPCCGANPDTSGLNDFMANIGSTITFAPTHSGGGPATITGNPLGSGVFGYSLSTFVPLVGGDAVALVNGEAGITTELVNAATVPEPTSIALWGIGLFGVAAARRRRRHA